MNHAEKEKDRQKDRQKYNQTDSQAEEKKFITERMFFCFCNFFFF